MNTKRKILIGLFALIVIVAGLITFHYWDQGRKYVKTEDARIEANTVTVSPLISGRIISLKVKEGDYLEAGDTIAWQETGTMATSAGINTNTLNPIGSVAAGKAEITAPISGEIIKLSAEPGQVVGPGQSLAVMADTQDLFVSANIEETSVGKVKKGQDVEITIDSLQNKKVMGKVEEIGKATTSTFAVIPTQNSNGSFTKVVQLVPVKIRFPGINKLNLLPGMSVEIRIDILGKRG
jgi:multidrug resistance efflux pump